MMGTIEQRGPLASLVGSLPLDFDPVRDRVA
jgi:hypothetical protein